MMRLPLLRGLGKEYDNINVIAGDAFELDYNDYVFSSSAGRFCRRCLKISSLNLRQRLIIR
jgi:hypothetical protein